VLIQAVTGDVGARRGLLRMALINRYFGAFFDVLLVFTPEIRASREGLVFKKFNFRTGS
jgi:hypothetical protein